MRQRIPSEPRRGLDYVIQEIVDLVNRVSGEKPVEAIGMGTAGTYDPAKDILFGAPHTPAYETPGFIGKIREAFKVPVVVENAATATIERSISPTNMTNVMPTERRHTVVPWTSTFEKVADLNMVGTKIPVTR